MAAKSTDVTTPSADQFVAEYMANYMNKPRAPKVPLLDRIAGFAERTVTKVADYAKDKVADNVADSKAYVARIGAAWEVADDIAEQAALKERQRQAVRMAKRLGLN